MRCRISVAVLLPALACLGLIWGCPSTGGGGTGGTGGGDNVNENTSDNDNANENDNASENDNENENTAGEVSLPAKSVTFELIGIHDPESDDYDGDCIGCHGERTGDVALDGETPLVHGTMLATFGEGNARCTACHGAGPDVVGYSGAGLRKQVDMTSCSTCHGPTPLPGATAFYENEG